MFKDYKYFVGHNDESLVFGYTKRTNGYSRYPKDAFNMALYIDDDHKNVHKHQTLLGGEINFPVIDWVMPIQGHKNNVYKVTKKDLGKNVVELTKEMNDIDALYTYERGILLAMNYADCTPIYVYSVTNDFVGLVHAGWKGTKEEVLKALLKCYDGPLNDLRVVIGVTINHDFYEVDNHVINESFNVHPSAVTKLNDNKFLLDLKTANKHQALEYGMNEDHIYVTPLGTEEDRFFSYRLEKGQTGRALGFIGRKL